MSATIRDLCVNLITNTGFPPVRHTGVVLEKHFIITDKYASLTEEEATENHKIS